MNEQGGATAPAQIKSEIVYGKNPVTELLKSGAGVDTVFLSEGMAPAVAARITPSFGSAKRDAKLRQQSMASSKLPTMAKPSAVMRAGSQSMARQAERAAWSSAWLTGASPAAW